VLQISYLMAHAGKHFHTCRVFSAPVDKTCRYLLGLLLDFWRHCHLFCYLLKPRKHYLDHSPDMSGAMHEHTDGFQALVQSLSEKLGPCSGINSDDVDEKELQQLMEDYVSDEAEWKRYSLSAPNTAYTRNLVDKGNGKSNLVLRVHHTAHRHD
jgi:hypothetical protein